MIPKMSQSKIENIVQQLVDYTTHSKISVMLRELRLHDLGPQVSKQNRMGYAIYQSQLSTSQNTALQSVIEYICDPAYLSANKYDWINLQSHLNQQLQYYGLKVNQEGKLTLGYKPKTYTEGQSRYNSLNNKLQSLNIHPRILVLCRPEILDKNYFHLLFEASKSMLELLREKSGVPEDGNKLVDRCFGSNPPLLALNKLETSTELSEQRGAQSLIKAIIYLYRNPKAHELKAYSINSETDAITGLIIISKAMYLIESAHYIK